MIGNWFVGIFSLVAFPALAYTSNNIITPQSIVPAYQSFVQGTDAPSVVKTLITAGASGTKCYSMWVSSTDSTASHSFYIYINHGGTNYFGSGFTVPIGAGLAGNPLQVSPLVSFWAGLPLDDAGNPYILLSPGDAINMTYTTVLGAGSIITVGASCIGF